MPAKKPRLEAEVVALTLLKDEDFVTKEMVTRALDLVPQAEWGSRYGGRVLSFGAYQRVANGLRTCCRRYPILTRLLTKFVTQWCPTLKFTTMTVMLNVNSPLPTDAGNSEVPGMLVALNSRFTGGELWIEHEFGSHTMYRNGVPFRGVQVDIASLFIFSAKRVLHGTCRWEGTRMVLAAYSTACSATNLSQEVTFRLTSLGFVPPTSLDEDKFRFEIWGATITRQLRLLGARRWPPGTLQQHGPRTIDIDEACPATLILDSESEEDDDAVSVCVGPSSPQPGYWECMLSEPEGDSFTDVEHS